MKQAEYAMKCFCGAITLTFDGIDYSVAPKNFESFFGEKAGEYMRKMPKKRKHLFPLSSCNHCVNHWGLDLCSCGSGKSPEKCCKRGPMQSLEDNFDHVRGEGSWGLG